MMGEFVNLLICCVGGVECVCGECVVVCGCVCGGWCCDV